MRDLFVSTEELSKITGINPSSLRTYLGNYRFTKFVDKVKLGDRYKIAIKLNKQCAYRLCEFFMYYKREDAVKRLEKYFEEHENV